MIRCYKLYFDHTSLYIKYFIDIIHIHINYLERERNRESGGDKYDVI